MSRIPVRTPARSNGTRSSVDSEAISFKAPSGRAPAARPETRPTSVSSSATQPLKVKTGEGFRTPARPQRRADSSMAAQTGAEASGAQTQRKLANGPSVRQDPGALRNQASQTRPAATEMPSTPSSAKAKSSAGLREHIAKARAELQKSAKKSAALDGILQRADQSDLIKSSTQLSQPQDDPFSAETDPFNQNQYKPKTHPVVERSIVRARQDGRLNISNCELKDIPNSVYDMYKPNPSQVIDFSNTDEPAWYEFVDLTYFNAADNELTEIGDQFVEIFGGVSNLDLHNNLLKSLPSSLLELSLLQTINVAGNGLDLTAFKLVCRIESLVELNFSRNTLQGTLDTSVSNLKNLTILDVSSNSLLGIGSSLSDCAKLQKLNLSGNKINQVTTSELSALTGLLDLDLSRNNISSAFIDNSMTFPRLETLNIAHNMLQQLQAGTEFVLYCPSLSNLVLLQNRLSSLDGLACPNLINLNIEGNHHTTFPQMIYDLPNLRHLDISDNRITELDYKIGSLPLSHFRWEGNPVRMRGCFGMDTVSLLAYLRNRAPQTHDS